MQVLSIPFNGSDRPDLFQRRTLTNPLTANSLILCCGDRAWCPMKLLWKNPRGQGPSDCGRGNRGKFGEIRV